MVASRATVAVDGNVRMIGAAAGTAEQGDALLVAGRCEGDTGRHAAAGLCEGKR